MFRSHSLRAAAILAFGAFALAAADELPKGEVVLDKYIDATGGKAAYSKLHSETTTGTMEFKGMGLKGKMTAYAAEPDKRYTEVVIDGVGKIQEGSNGEVAWGLSTMQGPRLKEGDEKAETLLQAKFNPDLSWRDLYKSAETVGVEAIDGKDCYKVLLTPKAGAPITKWYDKQSGYLVKMSLTAKTPMGDIQSDTTYADYRKEGEVIVPHKVNSHVATLEFVMTIESVQANTEIPKDKWEVPAEVKALMNKPAAK
jgi:outer membrane lipoprotein-sorting protein